LDEVLDDPESLCRHTFGNYPCRHLMQHGLPKHRHRIAQALQTDLMGNSRHRFASHVVEAALEFCAPEDQQEMACELIEDPDQLRTLADSQFGCFVVKSLLKMPGETSKQVAQLLMPIASQLETSKHGQRVVEDLWARISTSA